MPTNILFVKTTAGKTLTLHHKDEDYGDAANQLSLANALVTAHAPGDTRADHVVADGDPYIALGRRADYDNVVSISAGELVIDDLIHLRKLLKRKQDKKTKQVIEDGFEYPPPGIIQSGGTGYVVDDVLTVAGGTFVTAAQFAVLAVDGSGVITEVVLTVRGDYSVFPGNPATLTGGTGSGADMKVFASSRIPDAMGGDLFSMSPAAQMNWADLGAHKDSITYPIHFANIDDTGSLTLNSVSDAEVAFAEAFKLKNAAINNGALIKQAIEDAVSEIAAQSAYDDAANTVVNWKGDQAPEPI